jgi:hypothetical protein
VARTILIIGLMVGLIVTLMGRSESEANPFLGKWVVSIDKTREANREFFEQDEMVTKIATEILADLSLEVSDQSATMTRVDKSGTGKYTIQGDSLTLEAEGETITFRLQSDGKSIAMVTKTEKEGDLKSIILVKEES